MRTGILVLALALVAGCARTSQVTQFDGDTMGTTYQVSYLSNGGSAQEMQQAVEDLLRRINESLSTYIGTSTISRINMSTDATAWHPIDTHFDIVFRRSRVIYEDTAGAFNPAVGPLVNAWGFGAPGQQSLPDESTVRSLLSVVSFDSFELRDAPPAVRKKLPSAQLDFGAIAKGYGVDAIGMLLEQKGVKDYLVQIAGEVRARGRQSNSDGWRVGIERPADNAVAAPRIQTLLSLKNAAIATSGNYRNYRSENGKNFGHILNPKTGYPVENALLSVTVLAPDAMTADAYATAFVVMGLEQAMKFAEARASLEAYFIAKDHDGNIIEKRSTGFPKAER